MLLVVTDLLLNACFGLVGFALLLYASGGLSFGFSTWVLWVLVVCFCLTFTILVIACWCFFVGFSCWLLPACGVCFYGALPLFALCIGLCFCTLLVFADYLTFTLRLTTCLLLL